MGVPESHVPWNPFPVGVAAFPVFHTLLHVGGMYAGSSIHRVFSAEVRGLPRRA